jgi:FKBP-type peptidyl-prolyl cis-trans isomerase FkpA
LAPPNGVLYNARVILTRVLPGVVLAAAAALAAVTIAACGPAPTTPSVGAPYSQTDLRVGTGTEAVAGKAISVNYTGWLYDSTKTDQKGLQFDSSVGGTPLTFTLGTGAVIEGFDLGMAGMKIGGARRLVVPSSLGYGGVRNGAIPAFSTMVFDVELVDVQ